MNNFFVKLAAFGIGGFLAILILAIAFGLSFLFIAGLLALLCLATPLIFTWKTAFAIWIGMILIKVIFS